MLKRFLTYYKPHRLLFAADMAASLLMSLIAVIYPIVTRTMLNDLIPQKKYKLIIIAGISLFVLYAIRMMLNYFVQYQGHAMGTMIQARMRSDLFAHLEKLSFTFFDNHETGKVMSRLTSDLFDVSELAHHGPETVITCTVSIVISFVYLMTINIPLTLIIFACVPILIAVSMLTRGKQTRAFEKSRKSVAQINADVESSISGIRVTKAFTNSAKEQEKFEKGNAQFAAARKEAYKAMGEYHSVTTFITDVFNVVVLIAGGIFLYDGKINFADYSAFIVSINLFISPINTVIRFMESFLDGATGFKRFVEIMDTEPERDREGAETIDRLEGTVEFRNVVCGYEGRREILHGVSLNIGKGKTYALVGPSGGGKTTICHLIPRFYSISEGQILIDGKDINDITAESLRRNIGIVQQDVYLFNASIRDNILYGRLDATEEEIEEAAKRANIHDYILSLENGYDTVIGERGVKLSGGQKQRLCIARVFLKNPPILILDEATSALDNTTEIMIQKSLDELCKGRTTIVVAHRLSTIRGADEIAVISDGEIIEQGRHADLIAKGGAYAELYSQQFDNA